MLHALDRTLEALLREHMSPALIAQTSIAFATPGRGFPPPGVSLPAINLFLYDLQENGEYRATRGGWEERPDGTHARKPPPVRVDCHYLVTAWAPDGAPNPEHDEHRLLGAAMSVLLRFRELPRSVMLGAPPSRVSSTAPARRRALCRQDSSSCSADAHPSGDALDLVRPRDRAGRELPRVRALRHPPPFAFEPPTGGAYFLDKSRAGAPIRPNQSPVPHRRASISNLATTSQKVKTCHLHSTSTI